MLFSLGARWASFALFMQRVWALTRPYFVSDQKWWARGLLAAIVALNLGTVYMAVLFNDWYRVFYDAIQEKQQAVFWEHMGRFCVLAVIAIVIAVYKFYLTQVLAVRWRVWMTHHYLERWLTDQTYYKLELTRFRPATEGIGKTPDNPDQRIQEDIDGFTGSSIGLTMGLLNAVVTLVSFVGILWGLSGGFSFSVAGQAYNIPGFMVWMAVLYALAGSVLTHYIGRPQIQLNYQQQQLEANFRHHMVRVREYSEPIALSHGEAVEQTQLRLNFGHVFANYMRLIKARKQLIWFTVFYSQAAVVFPFIVAAPRYFSGAIQLGVLMQISSAFGRVQDALSWFVDSYQSLASWRATTDRLTGFEASFQSLTSGDKGLSATESGALVVRGLNLALPNGLQLLNQISFLVQPGDSVLLQGPSGSGKSTLFRALAGIWPYATGTLERPSDLMFIPQRPYFPNGPLREALAYPQAATTYSDAQLTEALEQALLPHLKSQLDQTEAWGQMLSGGEQQRLAIARVLLKKPKWVLADEATSALDEATENTVYKRLLALVKQSGGAIISIAHRPGVAELHTQRWQISPQLAGSSAQYQLSKNAS